MQGKGRERVQIANPQHEVAYQDLVDLLRKHAPHIDAYEMLAIAANLVGKLIAMQDQRKVTPEMAMQVVARNLEVGNKHVINNLSKSVGHIMTGRSN